MTTDDPQMITEGDTTANLFGQIIDLLNTDRGVLEYASTSSLALFSGGMLTVRRLHQIASEIIALDDEETRRLLVGEGNP